MTNRFLFGEEQFNRLFPYYLLVNRDLTIASFGSSVGKLFSLEKGQLFGKVFEMYGHTFQTLSFEYLESLNGYVVIFQSADQRKLQFRGEFQYNMENDQVLFAGAPLPVVAHGRQTPAAAKNDVVLQNPLDELNNILNPKEVASHNITPLSTSLNKQKTPLEKLAEIIEETINPVIIYDVNGKVEWVNNAFEKLSGFTLSEVKGTLPSVFLAGKDTNPDTLRYLTERYRKRLPMSCELLCYAKTGRPYWARINAQPILDKHGEVIRFFSIEEDITARKEAQRRSSDPEKRVKYPLEKMGENVWEYDFKAGDAN